MANRKKKGNKESEEGMRPGDRLQGSIIMLHGPYKVGKTTLASSFPRCWMIFSEPGHKYVPSNVKVDLLDPDTAWEDFRDLVNGPWKKGIKTIALDIIDNLYRACRRWYCKGQGISHPRDQPYLGWDMLRDEFTAVIEKLFFKCAKKEITLIFITHTKEEIIEVDSGTFTKFMTTLTGQARTIICPLPDHVWFMGYFSDMDTPDADSVKKNHAQRTLWLRGGEIVEAGCRDRDMKRTKITNLSEDGAHDQIVRLMNKPIKSKKEK
jgi:hypothetical protein